MQSLQEVLDERLGHLNLSADDYNSMACDIANDHAQAMLECGPDDYPDYDEEPDTSGPVHSIYDEICCYCGSDKEPMISISPSGETYVSHYDDCECRSIVKERSDARDNDDDQLPF